MSELLGLRRRLVAPPNCLLHSSVCHYLLYGRFTDGAAVVLTCTIMQPATARAAQENETILDQADGLNWKTLCRCDLLFRLPKATLPTQPGTLQRRHDIARKIIQGLAIAGL